MKAISVPLDTSRRTRELLDLLRVSQVELAKRVEISQPWVSKVLRSQQIRDTDAFKRLIRVVRQIVDEKISLGLIEEKQLPNIQQTLRLLDAVLGPRAIFALPGGAIPPEAENYVARPVINEAISCLDQIPFSMCVTGPADSGKTTVLGALTREAKNQGIRVSFVDCKLALKSELKRLENSEEPVDFPTRESVLANGIFRAASSGWELGQPKEEVVDGQHLASMFASLARVSQDSSPRLLVLDGITDTARGHPEYGADLLRMIRVLHNARATHGLDQLSLAVSLTWTSQKFYSHVRESSALAIFHPVLDVDWFSPKEVETLLSNLGSNVSAYLDILFEHYGGQPLLTHVATTRILEGSLMPNDVFAEALRGKGQFAYHVREVRWLLDEATTEAWEILRSLCRGEQPTISPFSEHLKFLINAHLVQEDHAGDLFIPSRFYHKLIGSTLAQEER